MGQKMNNVCSEMEEENNVDREMEEEHNIQFYSSSDVASFPISLFIYFSCYYLSSLIDEEFFSISVDSGAEITDV